MNLISFKEASNGTVFMVCSIHGINGWVKADIKMGTKALERMMRLHSQKSLNRFEEQYLELRVERLIGLDDEFYTLERVLSAKPMNHLRMRECLDGFKIYGRNSEAIFAIAKLFLERLNEIDGIVMVKTEKKPYKIVDPKKKEPTLE